MIIFCLFAAHWYLSLFFHSAFHHRYAAHRAYTMSRNWEKFFYICSFLTQGSSYISPQSYGILHRLHHLHADTPDDPHSPLFHPGLWKVMWQTRNSYHNIHTGVTVVADKIKKDIPDWKSFDRLAHNWITRLLWIALYVFIYVRFASSAWLYLLLPLTIIMSTLHGALVNWWAHRFGYRNFLVEDTSRNILPIDFLMLGEGYHNNHHRFPAKAKFSRRWFEIDTTFFILKQMHRLGIIRLHRQQAN